MNITLQVLKNTSYRVLLFYKFVPIHGYALFAQHHYHFCWQLGIKGRILIAPEGINGTLSGTVKQTDEYMATLKKDERFADIVFKIDETDGHVFDKLFVRVKEELVTFRTGEYGNPLNRTGKHLSPTEWYEMMQKDDVLILDGRTGYEYDLGHFKNAIRPPVQSFRDFPQWIRENLSHYKDKTILTYCTGGIRCEKLTAFMLNEGFKHVAQLEGGIVSYGKDETVKGTLWEGLCYVFDKRIAVPVNRAEDYTAVSACVHCGKPCDRYVNCANLDCHRQHFQCEECEKKTHRSCSKECQSAERHEFFT